MVDEFYSDINLELFFQWIVGNQNKYDQKMECFTTNIDDRGKKLISFTITLKVPSSFGLAELLKNK
ncbi:hypothetical protein SD457_01535 [Coprobacillaceae bacterium CR2/5/TPMF4]|nr:hypothetical protein SD457_01535 [Coprobacillaceae bacterium CR2/5/TPMF4]